MKAAASLDPQFPRVVLVHQSEAPIGDPIIAALWPEVSSIADPSQQLYEAFGLPRLRWRQLFRFASLRHTIRAYRKGNRIGGPRGGDLRRSPGILLIEGDRILREHPYEAGTGDHPLWGEFVAHSAAGGIPNTL